MNLDINTSLDEAVPKFTKADRIKKAEAVINRFWDTQKSLKLKLSGKTEVTEQWIEGGNSGILSGSYVLGVRTYLDKTYVFQAGIYSRIKVISPNSIEIYDIGADFIIMFGARYLHAQIAVISEDEVIVGYFYYDLKNLRRSKYGLDMDPIMFLGPRINPSIIKSIVRINEISWAVLFGDMIKKKGEIKLTIFSKTNIKECFDCEAQKELGSDMSCSKDSKRSFMRKISGRVQKFDTTTTSSDFKMSFAKYGHQGDVIIEPKKDSAKCLKEILNFNVFYSDNSTTAEDKGIQGRKVANYCSDIIMANITEVLEYKKKAKKLHDWYTAELLDGVTENSILDMELQQKSSSLIGPLLNFIGEITNTGSDKSVLEVLFERKIFWAPLEFALNINQIYSYKVEFNVQNSYTATSYIDFEHFQDLISMATLGKTLKEIPRESRYIVRTKKNVSNKKTSKIASMFNTSTGDTNSLAKFSKGTITTYGTPFGGCMEGKNLCTFSYKLFSILAEIEVRENGYYIWGWSPGYRRARKLENKIVLCFIAKGDKEISKVDEYKIPTGAEMVDGRAMMVSRSDNKDIWKIHDFFYDGEGISWVTSEVNINPEMKALEATSGIVWNMNIANSEFILGDNVEFSYGQDGKVAMVPVPEKMANGNQNLIFR